MNDVAASTDQKKDKKKREATVMQLGLAGAFGGAAYWALCLMRGGLPAGAVEIERSTWLWGSLGLCGFLGAFTAARLRYEESPNHARGASRGVPNRARLDGRGEGSRRCLLRGLDPASR